MALGNQSWNRHVSLVATLAIFVAAGCQSSQPKSPYAALAHDPAPQTLAQTGAPATAYQPPPAPQQFGYVGPTQYAYPNPTQSVFPVAAYPSHYADAAPRFASPAVFPAPNQHRALPAAFVKSYPRQVRPPGPPNPFQNGAPSQRQQSPIPGTSITSAAGCSSCSNWRTETPSCCK